MTRLLDEPRGGQQGPKRETGVAVIEFVLLVSVLCVLVFGSVEVISVVNSRLVLESAARDGARRAAIAGGDTPYVRERIAKQLKLGDIPPESVEVSIDPWSAPYGHSIRVRLTYNSPTVTPIGRLLMGELVRLKAEVLTRSEKIRS